MNNPSRRQILRGAGALAAGAFLTRLLEQKALAAPGDIKRIIFWYVPEGCAQQAFWPGTGPGALTINTNASIDGKLVESKGSSINGYRNAGMGTYCLGPLKAYEKNMLLLSGFTNSGISGQDPHKAVVNSALAGSAQNGRSLDQILGDHLKGTSPFHAISTTLFGAHAHHTASADYLTPTRYAGGGAGSPTWNPITTYNQIFPSGIPAPGGSTPTEPPPPDHSLTSRLALIGSVRKSLNAVRCQGGAIAQERMEAYLSSVERIEGQTQSLIDLDANGPPPPDDVDLRTNIPSGWLNTNNANGYWRNSDNFKALTKIQIDTTVAALALDRTRCSFLQFSGSGNDLGVKNGPYDGLHYQKAVSGLETSGVLPDHDLGHWASADENQGELRDQARVFRWYYSQLAYLLDRLKEVPDGNGTLFDSTLVFCCTEFGSYNHRTNDLPYVLIGNPGGAFKQGQYMDANNGGFRNHADLLLAIARGMGMNLSSFANSSNPYNAILV